ncbi:hypothetical protein [Streptomyces sp. B29(2018)]|uniref:hypothetical protein n=1 Tax=Streptomyces sp. B29(2018) TaxID=2485016 RepID=UPI000FD6B893|nr:hypothetical protein [Streptomyces sp. B29(2018)]
MLYTNDILDMMKERLGSYYKAAQVLDIHPNRVNQMRRHGGIMTDEQGLKAAEFLGVPAESVILSLTAERSTNSPAFDLLREIAEQHTPKIYAAASAVVVGILANLPSSANFGLI